MTRVRRLLAAMLVLLAAGCGGSEPTASPGTDAPAPAETAFYVELDTDRDSAQWKQVETLFARIPGAEAAIQEFLDETITQVGGDKGLDFENDIEPALGPRLVVVLSGDPAEPVFLTQPDDEAKLKEVLVKSDADAVTREIERWTAVAESEAALDAYQAALKTGTLSEQPDFAEAMADLPEEALARVYVDGSGVSALGSSLAGVGGGLPSLGDLGTLALALVAEDDGVRLTGAARGQEGLPASFAPKLLGRVPADALLAATFKGGDELTAQLRKALAGAGPLLGGFERGLGVSLDDVVALLSGETLLYVRPGTPLPEVTLVLEQTDPKQTATLDALFRALAKTGNTKLVTATEGGVRVTRLGFGPVSLAYGRAEGRLFVTTGRSGIADFRGANAKLVDDASFEKAAERVGYSGSTSAFVYADVDGLVPLLQGLAGLAGGGSTSGLDDLAETLGALDSLALNVATEGIEARLEGFLAVR